MKLYNDIPVCEPLDEFGWDHNEVRDLIQTMPIRFGDDGQPVGYDASLLREGVADRHVVLDFTISSCNQ